MALSTAMAAAVDAVYAGDPAAVPAEINLATTKLPIIHPYHGSSWLCFVIRCATNNELQFVKDALDAGADPNLPLQTTGSSVFPLHLAVEHGHADIVEELLSRGADRYAVTAKGRTADDILNSIAEVELPDTVNALKKALAC